MLGNVRQQLHAFAGTLALLGNVRQQLHAFAGSSIGQNLGIAEDLLVFKNKIAFDKRDAEEKR